MLKKRILLITSYFPPENHIASNRTIAMAKYLTLQGFDVYVLTDQKTKTNLYDSDKIFLFNSENWKNIFKFSKTDNFLSHKLKAIYNKLYTSFFIDHKPGFSQKASEVADEIISKLNINIIITSAAPLSCAFVGLALKRRHPSLLWISDLRDEIVSPLHQSNFLRKKLINLELQVIKQADLITSVSLPILQDIAHRHPEQKIQYDEIRNGYDFEPITGFKDKSDVFEIVYTGTIYGAGNPHSFFLALIDLKKTLTNFKFHVSFYCDSKNFLIPSELSENITIKNKVQYEKLPSILAEADALLMIQAKSFRKGIFTGKLFDYLAVNRPIIALIDPDDVAAQLIHECNAGHVVKDDTISSVALTIQLAYNDWLNGTTKPRNWEIINRHHRSAQIARLSKRIKNLLD